MVTRRKFLQLAPCGFIIPTTALKAEAPVRLSNNLPESIVSQAEDGETYYVRKNTAVTIHISKSRNPSNPVSFCSEEILPGSGIPVHKHLDHDEFFVFQNGTGLIEVDGKQFSVKAGTIGFVPRATWHSISNNSPSLLIFSFGYFPSGFEDFFREIGTVKGLPFQQKEPKEIQRIAEKYGMLYKV